MDRLHQLDVFVAVADAGSFAKAGKKLRLSPPAVTRAIASLEERLGVRLINRTTRRLNFTEAGQRFLEHAKRLLSDLDQAEKEASGSTGLASGHLTITAPVTFGRIALAPLVGSFLSEHPRVTASLVLLDRVVNLVEEGIDVAVRIGSLPDSSMVARKVGAVRRVMVASPGYLTRAGSPAEVDDLKQHTLIGFTGLMASREMPFLDSLSPRLIVNDAGAAIAAAEAGQGIASALCYMIGDRLRDGQLSPVLETYWPPAAPVHLVYPHSRLLAAKVRTFVDWSAPRLTAELARLSSRHAPGFCE